MVEYDFSPPIQIFSDFFIYNISTDWLKLPCRGPVVGCHAGGCGRVSCMQGGGGGGAVIGCHAGGRGVIQVVGESCNGPVVGCHG